MIVDPVLNPLLALPPLYAVLIVSFVVAIVITIVYKYATNQKMMKEIKEETAQMRKQIKDLKGQPEKLGALNKKMMEKQMKMMIHSFKPTIFTIIPIFLIFGWMGAHYGYSPITPGEEFTTVMAFEEGTTGEAEIDIGQQEGLTVIGESTQKIEEGKAEWTLKGIAGEYLIGYRFNDKEYTKDLLISEKQEYKPVTKKITGNAVKDITINNPNLKILNLFGWKLGWLGTYIIFSIVFSIGLRKAMKVY